jgi:membrane associated rhomboid family serine protease
MGGQITLGINLLIIAATIGVSLKGFQDKSFFDRYKFNPYTVSKHRDFIRILSHAVLHKDGWHLAMNMYVLYLFGSTVEQFLHHQHGVVWGSVIYIVMYVAAAAAATIPSFVKHSNNIYYSAIGASGAVSAMVFASIIIDPLRGMGILFIPWHIPGFIFGFLYLLLESVMNKRGRTNIAHDAHIAGAAVGVVFIILTNFQLLPRFLAQVASYFG